MLTGTTRVYFSIGSGSDILNVHEGPNIQSSRKAFPRRSNDILQKGPFIRCVVGNSLTERETSSARRFFDEEQRLQSLKNQDGRYLYKSRDCLWNKTSPKRKKGVKKIATFAREASIQGLLY